VEVLYRDHLKAEVSRGDLRVLSITDFKKDRDRVVRSFTRKTNRYLRSHEIGLYRKMSILSADKKVLDRRSAKTILIDKAILREIEFARFTR
jgi:hypothetical protein